MEKELIEALDALLGLAILAVPLWLFLHYRWKIAKAKHGMSDEDLQRMHALYEHTQRLEARLATLESILDAKAPQWREQ